MPKYWQHLSLKQICKCVSQGIFCGNTDNQRDARRVQFFGSAIDSYNSALKPLPRLPNLLYCKAWRPYHHQIYIWIWFLFNSTNTGTAMQSQVHIKYVSWLCLSGIKLFWVAWPEYQISVDLHCATNSGQSCSSHSILWSSQYFHIVKVKSGLCTVSAGLLQKDRTA